jgi:hypothetical protein
MCILSNNSGENLWNPWNPSKSEAPTTELGKSYLAHLEQWLAGWVRFERICIVESIQITLFCGLDLDRIPISNLTGMIGMAILWRATDPILIGLYNWLFYQIGLDNDDLRI